MSRSRSYVVFSDLDGSLLDHHTYSFAQAKPALEKLRITEIPVMLVSSKTRAEIEDIRETLGNSQPFIVENGAGIYVPKIVAPTQPEHTASAGEYWLYASVEPRAHWLRLIEQAGRDFTGEYQTFFSAGPEGIEVLTGLPAPDAAAASNRDYSEPVSWTGSAENKARFIARLRELGATVQQGGRFLSVSGDCDKGRAIRWLREQYRDWHGTDEVIDIAIGDSGNDVAMLEVAATALLIRSPNHEFPKLRRTKAVIHSRGEGPAGWSEGVLQWLDSLGLS